jgi:hypothetical protein
VGCVSFNFDIYDCANYSAGGRAGPIIRIAGGTGAVGVDRRENVFTLDLTRAL